MNFGNCPISIKQRDALNALYAEVFDMQVGVILVKISHSCFRVFLLLIMNKYIFIR